MKESENNVSTHISVVHADAIELEGFDALVVPANMQLTLGWGSHLAEKVMKLAGSGVEEEALQANPGGIALGEAVITSAGNLDGFRHLIHAAVLDKFDFNPLFLLRLKERTSSETLKLAVSNSLKAVEHAGLCGVVFTPMGAGIGGMKLDKCAGIMLAAIEEYFKQASGSTVDDVVIACKSAKAADVFRSVFGAYEEPESGDS